MGRWSNYSCIKFEENSSATPRIKFVKGDSCHSIVGAPGAGENYISEISLPDECGQVGSGKMKSFKNVSLFSSEQLRMKLAIPWAFAIRISDGTVASMCRLVFRPDQRISIRIQIKNEFLVKK
jgi:hypothetical protein